MELRPAQRPAVKNRLLLSLGERELGALRPHCERVNLRKRQILFDRLTPSPDVYFIEDGIVSVIADTGETGFAEVISIGREGMVGAGQVLNPEAPVRNKAMVLVPGFGFRMNAAELREISRHNERLQASLMAYAETTLATVAQCAACNCRHPLNARFARWLLLCRDRIDTDTLPLTHDILSVMLGVRRPGVTLIASRMQGAGIISYTRGEITITDRDALEAQACVCYGLLREEIRRKLA